MVVSCRCYLLGSSVLLAVANNSLLLFLDQQIFKNFAPSTP